MTLLTDTSLTEVLHLLVAFGLCGLIGIERQFRQKSAGFRTHVLVGTGSAAFTLVSAFGFASVLGQDVNLDPSRIAAQIVSGIGFLGAGVIFTRRDVVVGLTTAATIWVSAAVGMACGAGMVSLGIALTGVHLTSVVLLAPLVRRIPTQDHRRVLRITYRDGQGVLRHILETATDLGYTASMLSSRRVTERGQPSVVMDIRFQGRANLRTLMPALNDVDGVTAILFPEDEGLE